MVRRAAEGGGIDEAALQAGERWEGSK